MTFVSATCEGERCFCGEAAEHKVEEAIAFDDPAPARHPLTSYLCHRHFREIMGPAADRGRDIQTDIREATHVKLADGTVEKIASKWGIDPDGGFTKGGFGVVTETGRRVGMLEAHSYYRRARA